MVQRFVAFGLSFVAVCLLVTAAHAADAKPMRGTVKAIDATAGTITITVTSKADKTGTDSSYTFTKDVSVTINGASGAVKDIAVGDKIGFKLDNDGKVMTDITKGRKMKKPAA